MDRIDAAALDLLPLPEIVAVTFFKRDELATDLICCEIEVDGRTWFFHEDAEGWDLLLRHLEQLPGFRTDWHGAVAQPPFESCDTIAYQRPASGPDGRPPGP